MLADVRVQQADASARAREGFRAEPQAVQLLMPAHACYTAAHCGTTGQRRSKAAYACNTAVRGICTPALTPTPPHELRESRLHSNEDAVHRPSPVLKAVLGLLTGQVSASALSAGLMVAWGFR